MIDLTLPEGWGRSDFALVVPARNEARRLPRALASYARDRAVTDVLIVANGCDDGTADLARSHRGRLRVGVIETGRLDGGVGEARRLGAEVALSRLSPDGRLATTDADCELGPDWGTLTRRALKDADVVCGQVVPERAEFLALPPLVRRHGMLEDLIAEVRANRRIGITRIGRPRVHDQASGASLAFRARAYVAAGGFDPVPCHEDRMIVARMERMGFRIARPAEIRITASCRLIGRAPGGMASTISGRMLMPGVLRSEISAFEDELRHAMRG